MTSIISLRIFSHLLEDKLSLILVLPNTFKVRSVCFTTNHYCPNSTTNYYKAFHLLGHLNGMTNYCKSSAFVILRSFDWVSLFGSK